MVKVMGVLGGWEVRRLPSNPTSPGAESQIVTSLIQPLSPSGDNFLFFLLLHL